MANPSFGKAIDDGKRSHTFKRHILDWLYQNTVNTATPNHYTQKHVCSHLISALENDTTFETDTQTMAAAKAAIRTSIDWLHEQELKRITDRIPAATNRTILVSQETGKWMQTPPSFDTSMELASLIWNSEMHCIIDCVEHNAISPLIAMVVELNFPSLMV